eukprot:CAMPEP_0178435854 /NCGR_PEP_ID=MMETSP0689_2-20121128/34142_1 /TAXON_ID=160604 /ORGANISM="Amphidinium massartii, Strain CS-259" /LENGTH=46 /DNA_ID= /DNA_START= /DNA_END= /DNA_ORIENTATION=
MPHTRALRRKQDAEQLVFLAQPQTNSANEEVALTAKLIDILNDEGR